MAHTCAGSPAAGLVSRWVPFWTSTTNNDLLMYVRGSKKKTAARGARPPPRRLPMHGGARLLPQRARRAVGRKPRTVGHAAPRCPPRSRHPLAPYLP